MREPSRDERALVERLRLAEVHWLEAAQDEADVYGEGTDDQDGMEDMADLLGKAAAAITSLSQEVERLKKERDSLSRINLGPPSPASAIRSQSGASDV